MYQFRLRQTSDPVLQHGFLEMTTCEMQQDASTCGRATGTSMLDHVQFLWNCSKVKSFLLLQPQWWGMGAAAVPANDSPLLKCVVGSWLRATWML